MSQGWARALGASQRLSRALAPTLKEAPSDAHGARSHALLLRSGFVRQTCAGVYSFLPLGLRTVERVAQIVREELHNIDCQECRMPLIMPRELWEQTGRWESTGDELIRFHDRKGHDFCLGPTHEEAFTELVARTPLTRNAFPLRLYQIGTKFRDELRPRFGLLRCREFVMKDLYTFDLDESLARETYAAVSDAYARILDRLGLPYARVRADTGNIGGSESHEYHVLADVGEDTIVRCALAHTDNAPPPHSDHTGTVDRAPPVRSDHASNVELAPRGACGAAACCGATEYRRGIEVGHVFLLGTKYSASLGAHRPGDTAPLSMGCYGLGVTRIVAAAAEVAADDKGMAWHPSMAPYVVNVVEAGGAEGRAERVVSALVERGIAADVLADDRQGGLGSRLADADLLGIPVTIVVSQRGNIDDTVAYGSKWQHTCTYSQHTASVELQLRRDGTKTRVSVDAAADTVAYLWRRHRQPQPPR